MKKYLLLISLSILFLRFDTFSQKSFPDFFDAPQWHVLVCTYGMGNTCNTLQFEYAYDTVFCGHNYIKILSNYSEYNKYIRNEGQKVFLKNSTDCMDKEYLLYDFSLNTGDTVYCGLMLNKPSPLFADTSKFWVTQTDSVIYNGIKRKSLLMYYYSQYYYPLTAYGGYWIEGIGSTLHPFYPLACIENFCEQTYDLLCYDSSDVLMYQNTQYQTCDTTIVFTETKESNYLNSEHISVFPNPFSTEALITLSEHLMPDITKIEIFDVHSMLVISYSGVNSRQLMLKRSNFGASGVYILRVSNENYRETIKLMIL